MTCFYHSFKLQLCSGLKSLGEPVQSQVRKMEAETGTGQIKEIDMEDDARPKPLHDFELLYVCVN